MADMWTRIKLGQTQDDAAGEAFDKVAKMMGL
jgi:tRNA A37 threonylcarbamoyltransferase TsaD